MTNHNVPKRAIERQTEIALHVPNEPRQLARLFSTLATLQRSIRAASFYSHNEHASVAVLANDNSQAAHRLRAAGFACETRPVIALEQDHHPVSAVHLTRQLRAAGINVLNTYTCSSPVGGSWLVLNTTDNPRAAAMLDELQWLWLD